MSPSAQRAQSGQAALILVIFIIVVLALLLAALAYITAGSNRDTGLTVLSTRAYYAAQSGAEWGTYQLVPATGSPASTCFSSPQNLTLADPGLAGCIASVSCTSLSTGPGGPPGGGPGATATTTSFQVSSVGTCAAGAYNARREIVVGTQLTQVPPGPACQALCNQQLDTCLAGCGKKDKACKRTCDDAFNSCKKECKPGGGGLDLTSLRYWLENP
ncbi:MAG: hypothetical protein ACYCPA_00525 [Acidithiobacillus sp.]